MASKTTELSAINDMLSAIGDSPINTLEGSLTAQVTIARNILETETRKLQAKGWHWNTDEEYSLTPDVDGYIHITEGMVKVIAEDRGDGTGGTILGVHMVGPWVTEQLGQGYLAVNWEATVDEVAAFIQPHPTLSELFGETVLSLTGRSLHG